MGFGEACPYESAGEVFDESRRTWNPKTGYDLRGISYAKLRQKSRQWPCAPGRQNGEPIRYLNQPAPNEAAAPRIKFPTESGRANFFARPYLPPAELPDAEFPFVLVTGRLAHQWHTMTKTGKVAALNRLNPGPFVEIHPEDAAALGVKNGTPVKVSSRRGFAIYPAAITAGVLPGNCFAPFHWNDRFGENLAVNAVTSEARDAISLQPELKFAAVSLARVAVPGGEDFTDEQKAVLHELLHGVSGPLLSPGLPVPELPETAPFSAAQRRHVNELLARLYADGSAKEKAP